MRSSNEESRRVSVVVPCYNAKKSIRRCLQSLLSQHSRVDLEILVVDSSEDGTDEIIRREFPQVSLIHLEQKTLPGAARNRGARQAKSPVVVFTDADCEVDRDWVTAHLERQKTWDIVGGAIENANPQSLVSWASFLSEFNGFTPCETSTETDNVITANVSYKRWIFDEDGFDEDLFPGEDRLFHFRLARRHPIRLDRTIVVGHNNRDSLNEFLSHQEKLGFSAFVARQREPLSGSWLARHPLLIWLTPIPRALVMLMRVARDTPRLLSRAVLVLPLVVIGGHWWALGFFRASKLARTTTQVLDATA